MCALRHGSSGQRWFLVEVLIFLGYTCLHLHLLQEGFICSYWMELLGMGISAVVVFIDWLER